MPEASAERLAKYVRRVLGGSFWISDLKAMEVYSRLHDDHDGTFTGHLAVALLSNGDAVVSIEGAHSLRFRDAMSGGGRSPRVRNALMILAYAIELDNEEDPIEEPQPG